MNHKRTLYLSSPAAQILIVWVVLCGLVAFGPIEYGRQPLPIILGVVVAGIAIFLIGYRGGRMLFEGWFARQRQMAELPGKALDRIVMAASLLGILGIGLVAIDRTILSGVNNGGYAEMLRCAPGLIDAIAIKRTPLLYLGYVMFSFGFVSLVLFLLKGEQIRGWPAALAQLSIVSPVGYAVLYSGRMPILFVLVLVMGAMLVRLAKGRSLLPRGHHLLLKTGLAVGLFAVYSSSIWTTRQSFCAQMSPLIDELQIEKEKNDKTQRDQLPAPGSTAAGGASQPKPMITASDLSKKLDEAKTLAVAPQKASSMKEVLAKMQESWNVKPRAYVVSAIEAGHLSARSAMITLSTYFYLTHGVRTLSLAWQARDQFTRHWGIYEVGVLSPILRVFFPGSQQLARMEAEQRSAGIYGFFPTAWLAAFIDFGFVGAAIYILIWGGLAGWSAAGSEHSNLMTPELLLVFVLTSIMLSPVQGPLGLANSALVLGSMLVTGLALDLAALRAGPRQDAPGLQLNSGSAT